MKSFICAAMFGVVSQSLLAANCTISATSYNFGVYDVFSAAPNNRGIGNITISCTGGTGNVKLSTGQSNSYAPRLMKSGANILTYNLYTSATRNKVWGDGSGGSITMTAAKNATTNFSVYGQIPPQQDVAVGIYTDSITAIVNF